MQFYITKKLISTSTRQAIKLTTCFLLHASYEIFKAQDIKINILYRILVIRRYKITLTNGIKW